MTKTWSHPAVDCGVQTWRARPQRERTEETLRAAVERYADAYALPAEETRCLGDDAVRQMRGSPWLWADRA